MKIKDIVNMLSEKKYYILLYIIIIILINLVGSTLYFRLDLTRNGAYSLSDISKDVVSSLEDPLTIKVFFTEDLPAPYNAVYRYIADVLEEYSQYGNRNFHYEFIDVEKQKAMASDFGVYPVQVREIKDDQVKLRNAYMGLVIVHGDLVEKLESITQAEGVEYRITSLMKKMIGKIDSLLKLEAPIRVTLYASSDLPLQGMKDINEKVETVVKKSSSKNFDKITYRYVDPSVEKDLMSVAETFGLPPIRWPSFTSMTGQRVKAGSGIIGIVVENGDAFETIGVLSRNIFGQIAVSLDDLEDRINSAIDNLININPKIGYIAGHDEKDLDDENMGVTNFRKLISDMYDFEVIDLTKNDIPDDITTIVVNGPKKGFAELLGSLREIHIESFGSDRDLLVGLQLTHSGRFSRPDPDGKPKPRILYHHPILDTRVGIDPSDDDSVLTDEQIEELIVSYIEAADLAREIGFDFVDIKHCHGYLGHEFLGARTRAGRYGGSLENRTRFLREIVTGIRREAPGLPMAVRISAFDTVPYRGDNRGRGVPEEFSHCLPYEFGFGVDPDNPLRTDLGETLALIGMLDRLDIRLINLSCGSPYYTAHILRPAYFPPSDGYWPPQDPLIDVTRQIQTARMIHRAFPDRIHRETPQEGPPEGVETTPDIKRTVDSPGAGRYSQTKNEDRI